MGERELGDISSQHKVAENRKTEEHIYAAMSKSLGIPLPTRAERMKIHHADKRSRQGEVWSGYGDTCLQHEYPIRDRESERLTKFYARKYPPSDQIRTRSRAVAEFVRRFHEYKKLITKETHVKNSN